MNVIARLEYELAYYDSAVHRFNHYTTRTPQKSNTRLSQKFCNILVTWDLIWCFWILLLKLWRWQTTFDSEMLNLPDTLQVLLAELLRLLRWQITLDCEMLNSPDTLQVLLAELLRLWRWKTILDSEMLNSPDTLQVLLTELLRLWRWQITLDCEMLNYPSATRRIGVYSLDHDLRIHGF